ncbi:MAG: hypothetical protein LBC76_02485, partial [Treponema sp.]|nr:hypothetical protein [Treponema sp.]
KSQFDYSPATKRLAGCSDDGKIYIWSWDYEKIKLFNLIPAKKTEREREKDRKIEEEKIKLKEEKEERDRKSVAEYEYRQKMNNTISTLGIIIPILILVFLVTSLFKACFW